MITYSPGPQNRHEARVQRAMILQAIDNRLEARTERRWMFLLALTMVSVFAFAWVYLA
jgi:hypothetical protein